jgi:hypothetical protein
LWVAENPKILKQWVWSHKKLKEGIEKYLQENKESKYGIKMVVICYNVPK